MAAPARCCERIANASWSARETWNSSATFSPVSGIASTPYCAFISGLMKRQPMVVSKISAERENASGALPITNGARGADRVEPGSAEPVERLAGNRVRHAGQQQRHARHVAVVLAGLVGAAEIDFIDLGPIEIGMPRHQGLDRGGAQIVGTHLGQRTAETADRGPHGITNKYITH